LKSRKIPPSPPFFKGGNGGFSADALLKREMQRNMATFFQKTEALPFLELVNPGPDRGKKGGGPMNHSSGGRNEQQN
jgi:hypothetical protein